MLHSRRLEFVIIKPASVWAMMLAESIKNSERSPSCLMRYGPHPSQAKCVGEQTKANLSIRRLQQLGGAARAYDEDNTTPSRQTVADLARVSPRIEQVKLSIEVGKAATGCGVLANGTRSL